jgi:cytochrome c
MKKLVLALFVIALSVNFTSCKDAKKAVKDAADKTTEAVKETTEKTTEAVKDVAEKTAETVAETTEKVVDALSEQATKGKEIATKSGCLACHKEHEKSVGPSYEEVAKVYKEKKGNMSKFLKGNADAIVDPAQFPVMKVNIPITQKLSGDDLAALTSYIRSFE